MTGLFNHHSSSHPSDHLSFLNIKAGHSNSFAHQPPGHESEPPGGISVVRETSAFQPAVLIKLIWKDITNISNPIYSAL